MPCMPLPVALITGATRGIGRAVAELLAPDHQLLLGGRDHTAVQQLADQFPSAEPFAVDLTDAAAVAAACAGVEKLDVLVLSAGIEALGSMEQLTREQWTEVLEVNVVAVAELTRLLLPALRAAHGHVIAINSGAGKRANPEWGAYAASKFALKAWADALRQEEKHLRVTSIHPGRVDTEMQQRVRAHEGAAEYDGSRFLRPESVARAVRFALDASEDAVVEELSIRPHG